MLFGAILKYFNGMCGKKNERANLVPSRKNPPSPNTMNFKYKLPDNWIPIVADMEEFANGATQVTVDLVDGRQLTGILISDATYIVAMRGYKDLPFLLDDIQNIVQSDEDKNPAQRGGWDFWDSW